MRDKYDMGSEVGAPGKAHSLIASGARRAERAGVLSRLACFSLYSAMCVTAARGTGKGRGGEGRGGGRETGTFTLCYISVPLGARERAHCE